ncbi:MAG: hypothetical protein O7B81_02490, partial [Gammaproteobacteria bacterium]|nr:hypothetical protein [Gammaproteobacteria bacterium]
EAERERRQREAELQTARERAEASRRIARRTTIGLMVSLVLAIAAGLAGFFAYEKQQEAQIAAAWAEEQQALAEKQAEIARAQKVKAEAATELADSERERAEDQAEVAREAGRKAATLAAGFLSSLAKDALAKGDVVNAVKFALAAWPRDADSLIPTSDDVLTTLSSATPRLRDPGSLEPGGGWMACGPHGDDRVVMQQDEVTTVFDIATGKELHRNRSFPSVPNLVVSRDGNWFATGSYQDVGRLVDAAGNRVTRLQVDEDDAATIVALSHDEKMLAVGEYRESGIQLWDPAEHRRLKAFRVDDNQVDAMGLSPDGNQIVINAWNGGVHLWNTQTEKEIGALKTPAIALDQYVFRIGFTANGRVIFAIDRAGALVLWDAETREEIDSRTVGLDTNGAISTAVSNGALIAIGYKSGAIALIDFATGKQTRKFFGHPGAITTIAFSADGRRLASGGTDGTARLWNLETGAEIARFKVPRKGISCVTFMPDQRRVAVFSYYAPPVIWTIDQNSEITWRDLSLPEGSVSALSGDGRYLISASPSRRITLFETTDMDEIDILPTMERPISSIAVSSDGSLFAVGMDNTAEVWDRASKSRRARFDLGRFDLDHQYTVSALAFSPDNARLAIGGRTYVNYIYMESWDGKLWLGDIVSESVTEAKSGSYNGNGDVTDAQSRSGFRSVGAFGNHDRFAISGDGRLLATEDQRALHLLDIATGATIARLGHAGVTGGATALATALAAVWHQFTDDAVSSVAFSTNRTLLFLSPDGRLGTWDLSWIPDGYYFQIVCGLLPHYGFSKVSEEYDITIDEPVCGEGYDPPLPDSKK